MMISANTILDNCRKGTILSGSALILQDYFASASATATATATVAPTMGLLPKNRPKSDSALIGAYLHSLY